MAGINGELETGMPIDGGTDGTTIGNVSDSLKVNVTASALPTGAATLALQATGNTSLSSIDSKTPALGQALAAGSTPVVLTAAQIATLTPLTTVAVTQSGTWTVQQGATPTAVANAWPFKLTDGTNTTAVKAASTAATATDPAAVVALSPNSALPTGTNNIGSLTNITGTISLPTGAATSANQTTEITSLQIIDNPIGPVSAGTAGTNSFLTGLVYNSTAPTLTTGQQVATQGDVNGKTKVVDICDGGGLHAALTVGTTAVLACAGGASTNLTNRKSMTVFNNGTVLIYWGLSNAVTTSTGTPVTPGSQVIFTVGANTSIYLISGTASQNTRVTEMA